MPRVICDLPNASNEISGVKFHQLKGGGLISDEISETMAELFVSIPGYTIDDEEREPVQPVVAPPPTTRKVAKKAVAEPPVVQSPADTTQPLADKPEGAGIEEVF